MSGLSDYAENEILDHILGTSAYTMPTTVYVGLSTGSFGDDNSGTELSGSGYARQSISFGAAASGTASNDAAVEFPAATGSWGTVSHFGIFDAASSGNLLIHGALTASKVIDTGDILKIAIGDMDITAA
ncbi:head protein [Phage C72C1]|nr:head protein [Phage C72C1]